MRRRLVLQPPRASAPSLALFTSAFDPAVRLLAHRRDVSGFELPSFEAPVKVLPRASDFVARAYL
jgi:hypothetical protein